MRRPYWFSIRAYPPNYRREYGEELIETAQAMTRGRWSARQASSFLLQGTRQSVVDPRRWWGLAVLFPVLFAVTQAGVLFSWSQAEPTRWYSIAYALSFVFKWLTIPSLPLLLALMAERISERPHRWLVATASWIVLGCAFVLAVTALMLPISEAITDAAYHRMWPNAMNEQSQFYVESTTWFGSSWTPFQVTVRELVAAAAVASAAGLVLGRCASRNIRMASAAVPVTVMGVLTCYRITTPWAFNESYDFFVGDAVVGATAAELMFFFAPFDPIAGMLIGLVAISMGGLLLAWGGARAPVDSQEEQRRLVSV